MDAKKLVETIQDYSYCKARLKEVQDKIESIAPKVTATYGNLAPSMSNGFSSKVETQGNRLYELHRKEKEYSDKIELITKYIEHSGLSEREKELMWWIGRNGKLQAFARRENIGKDNIYKIRDRAVNKILAAQIPQKVVQNYKNLHYASKCVIMG